MTSGASQTGGRIALAAALTAALAAAAVAAVLSGDALAPAMMAALTLCAAFGVFSALLFAFSLFPARGGREAGVDAACFLDASPDGCAVAAPQGKVAYANPAYRRLMGEGADIYAGLDRIASAWGGSAEAAFRLTRAARRGRPLTEEFAIGGDGGGAVLRVSVAPIGAGRRALNGWRFEDVTAERRARADETAKLAFASAVLSELDVGAAVIDESGGFVFANAVLADWLDAESLAGAALADFMPGGRDDFARRFDVSVSRTEAAAVNMDLVAKDGSAFPARMIYTTGTGEDGAPRMPALFLNQQSAAHADERGARAGEAQFLKLFQSAPIAMGKANADGRLVFINASMKDLLGAESADPEGASLIEMVAEKSRPQLMKALAHAAAGKAGAVSVPIVVEGEPQRSGRLYVCAAPNARRLNGDGLAMVYGVDTSEQRHLEEQIAQSQKMQAVGQLAGGVAHDFNNILTAIIGFSELLLAKHRPGDPAFQDIMNIRNNANRAAGLVRQLLAFSRKQTLRPRVVSITDVIEDATILLQRVLEEKVTLEVIHGRDLWEVKADENQLNQVIVNLAVNARDAMPNGGKIIIRTANVSEREATKLAGAGLPPGEYVMCEVADAGCGIPADKLEKIFEPFYTTKEVGKGTGLGLSTVYGIVQQTGGHITVESELDVGTSFKVYLPRFSPAEMDTPAPKVEKKEKPRDLTGTGTVLLVEDEDAVRAFAARALATRGYKVLEAVSGVDALRAMERHGPEIDLVISDVVMPEMDGPALLKRLRAQNPDIKFIFISGYAEDAFKGAITESEQFTFLPKPFSLKQLAAAVKEALSSAV
ncbi:MAG: PAS domain-containing protein [Hyphomicrobiales bacterium]|nr:PAS domain-containing protein [Hyphomicrobiales bacterium]